MGDDERRNGDIPMERCTPDASVTDVSEEVLTLDYLYDALHHPRRRHLCAALFDRAEWPLSELATRIAAREHDVPASSVTERQHESVYVSLYHAHVPELVADGVVTFDEMTETVRPGETADQVLAALAGIDAYLDL